MTTRDTSYASKIKVLQTPTHVKHMEQFKFNTLYHHFTKCLMLMVQW